MTNKVIGFEITVDQNALKKLNNGLQFERASKEIVTAGLKLVEDEQIKAYSAGNRPSPPSGSTYKRTFKLQRSSRARTKKVRKGYEGIWDTDGTADYDKYVLGIKSNQAGIHRGRWKSIEQVVEAVDKKLTPIADEIIDKEAKKI